MGPCDIRRFDSLSAQEREHLTFEADFCLAVLKKRPYQFETLQVAANSLTALGYYQDGLKFDQRLEEMRPSDALVIFNLACSLSLVGRVEDAMEKLEAAVTLGYRDRQHIKEDPDLENLRSHPRFKQLEARLNALC